MNLEVGYMIPQEQYDPVTLLNNSVLAEKWGFQRLISSDHFHPWSHTNAAGGFAWVWLASAAERTKHVVLGTEVSTPTFRYNPAIVAQAFATLGYMYPNRVFLGVGVGEAMNEVPVGFQWPLVKERVERLEEAIRVIKMLWEKEFVSFKGKYYTLRKANLYTKPRYPVPLIVSTLGIKVAEIAGRLADGINSFVYNDDALAYFKNSLFPAFEKGAKSRDRDPTTLVKSLEIGVSYDEDYEKALKSCRFWAGTLLPFTFKYEIYDPREIEENAAFVGDENLGEIWIISTDIEEHIKRLQKIIDVGVDILYIQSSSPDEKKFIETYGKEVLPYLKEMK